MSVWIDYWLRTDPDTNGCLAFTGDREIKLNHELTLSTNVVGLTSQGSHQVLWVPDKEVAECHYCNMPFSIWRRRHHCRHCGNVFCKKCWGKEDNKGRKVCDMCYDA